MTGLIEKLLAVFTRIHWLLQWLVLSILAILLYLPILNNYFVNDDFIVLNKVCLQKKLNTDGFFRPLSDISIYINYWFSGFNPLPYRITSVLIHALNALLLFRFCLRCSWTADEHMKRLMAVLAAVFFLVYPFHNEPVVWLLGRASLLASTFAFLALAALSSSWRDAVKMPVVAICYFIAMTGYETVMVLPAIIFIWLLVNRAPVKKILIWIGILALVLAAHFIIRVQVSGSATGEYGGRLIQWNISELFTRAFKVFARMFVPPNDSPTWIPVYEVLVGFIVVVVMGALIWFLKKIAAQKNIKTWSLAFAGMLFFALLLPFMIGVSTRSSESDRLLYFPSFFLCPVFALVLLTLFYKPRRVLLFLGILTVVLYFNITLLQQNNYNWSVASRGVARLLNIIKEKPANGKLYIIHMPDDVRGAYVFRVGFKEALKVNNLDTTGIVVFNRLRKGLENSPRVIDHYIHEDRLDIVPEILIPRNGYNPNLNPGLNKYDILFVNDTDRVVYWNRYKWILLDPQALFK